ncbi:MAG: ATP-dependent DNA helicase RecG [Rickettsiales bacterium]|jgi:ATP-dependent DNA helicase RecG|nr:ATP-dependent DNA helicase RecG [Rickettsiales bacterium]
MRNNLSAIPGLGAKAEESLKRLNITCFADLFWHFPNNVIHKSLYPPLHSINGGDLVILRLKIIDIDQPNNPNFSRRKPFKIYCGNDTGRIQLLYFNYNPQYLLKWAKVDSEIIAIGKIELFNGFKQLAHPEVLNPNKPHAPIIKDEVIYPLTYGIVNKQIQKYISFALDNLQEDEEWISASVIKKFRWDGFKESLYKIHHPKDISSVNPYAPEKQRIAYDELLATQLMVNLLRQYKNKQMGRSIVAKGDLLKSFLCDLPFELTHGQHHAIAEIISDQESCNKMSRLLQGDVGSGKTVVALAAILNVVESKGQQAVLMAPTDVLANQHFQTLEKFFTKLPIKYALLTGKTKAKDRKIIMDELSRGELQILVGTHAVFQDKVLFYDLALVVIDEQHRFGVEQRLSLVNKGNKADLLIMSATPIPRSLSLALYGDMDITKISEKPKSRVPIKTSILPKSKLNDIIQSLDNILKSQGKIYWVCPLISESEDKPIDIDLEKTAAEARVNELSKCYPGIVGLVHGQLDSKIKQENLNKFIEGDYRILVATTVIEVGVDVPDATVIIIENAESFGLSQLHQLRGRVGRGNKSSHCILLYQPPISNISWQRLKILRETDDGFVLAEEDLKLRGGGDIIGTKQSGLPNFKTVDFIAHHQLIADANFQAKEIIKEDPMLAMSKNRKYQRLLSLFGFEHQNTDW